MLMPRASGSVFKLCKSNINAKPVINNLSASSRWSKWKKRRKRREAGGTRQSVRRKNRLLDEKRGGKRAAEIGRERERARKREEYQGDGKRLYYTCLGAFSLRLREQDEKARTLSARSLFHALRGQGRRRGGHKREREREGGGILRGILRKGAEEF